jgi:hypothetical protein
MSIYRNLTIVLGFLQHDNRERLFTVLDNLLVEDDNNTLVYSISRRHWFVFQRSSQGVLKDSILTFKGSWFHTGFTTQTFKIVAYKMDK